VPMAGAMEEIYTSRRSRGIRDPTVQGGERDLQKEGLTSFLASITPTWTPTNAWIVETARQEEGGSNADPADV